MPSSSSSSSPSTCSFSEITATFSALFLAILKSPGVIWFCYELVSTAFPRIVLCTLVDLNASLFLFHLVCCIIVGDLITLPVFSCPCSTINQVIVCFCWGCTT
ncbi:hypothetical protein DAI22_01g115000 [Oryza sativa Japonica Group]|nr:hypothetical protein DAI22_01g115000 [Oryza sativa Japonica Group]